MKPCTLFLLTVTLLAVAVEEINGVCCYPHWFRCGDCTWGTPYCGHQKCNWHGCDCKGGCRTGPCVEKLPLFDRPIDPAVVFSKIDANGDSAVDILEFYQHAKAVTLPTNGNKGLSQEEFLIKEFVKMDKNQDGKISPGEFDNDLE